MDLSLCYFVVNRHIDLINLSFSVFMPFGVIVRIFSEQLESIVIHSVKRNDINGSMFIDRFPA